MKISVEIFINNQWITEIRYYNISKSLNSFDLCNVKNKRRNAKLL